MQLKFALYCLTSVFLLACGDNDEESKDLEKPQIDMSLASASPQNCEIVYRGESFRFAALFSDNVELGSYNIEIHNNFDHHSHSTDAVECDPEPNKKPVTPFVFNQDYAIPDGRQVFEASNQIQIPADIDTGDYHFMVRLTDKAGWQELKAISLKIMDRE